MRTLQIQKDVKVFLNIAWDKRVPAPPEAGEDVIRRAMAGEDLDVEGLGAYYVPVVVSEPREDVDKSGKPSIVFDCVFSASLKLRCIKDREFKLYLIELALEHVEEKAHFTLSRQIGTPNIVSKGKLEPRTVLMPRTLVDPNGVAKGPASRASPLVQELPNIAPAVHDKDENKDKKGGKREQRASDITDKTNTVDNPNAVRKPKSILKNSSAANASEGSSAGGKKPHIEEVSTSGASGPDNVLDENKALALPPLRWKWRKEGERLKIEIEVPDLMRDLHAQATLDIESRRILLHIPQKHFLDINLDLSDAQIGKLGEVPAPDDDTEESSFADVMKSETLRVRGHNAGEALRLKRQRDFDVEDARAEWRIGEQKLIVSV
ncbi:uncharacterized protein FOMMEDRAFT_105099 [Fomitiporia mediterranea MF3/22]|uniref:uncharacterized protein n=1 Tax=Fomitiporia mediterranea (strain MF3/22) TaxID=694068 RepID=UPI0004408B38|nr:uncharacterized protein FOMMEDRAFT_105099 [Fomitiporia mediterranea MF3/22]EJD04912.1 hypothetical protein FOMMEDRAFT_105099 [Fomitiporia mediterranea MF3/22]